MRTTDIPTLSITQLNGLFAPLSATNKFDEYSTGDLCSAGYDMIPNGYLIGSNRTLTSVQLTFVYPTIGGSSVWAVVLDRAGVKSNITTVTVASGARGAVVNSLSFALQTGDLVFWQNTAANGTYVGLGPTFRMQYGGSLALPTAPTITSGLSTTTTTSTITVNWTGHADTFSYLIRRDGVPYAVTGLTTFTDSGLPGIPMTTGETHTYYVDALVPGNITVNSTGVVGAITSLYTYFPSIAQAVSALTTDFAVALGSNSGTGMDVDATGLAKYKSGAVGGFATQDGSTWEWKRGSLTYSGSNYSAWTRTWDFGMGSSACDAVMIWNVPAFVSLATSVTNYLQMHIAPSGYIWRIKAAGFNSGNSYVLTDTATSPAQATTVAAGGTIGWPITVATDATGATRYSMKVDLLPINGNGTQTINIYMGTLAQRAGNTLPLINTITITAAQRSALAIGGHWTSNLGSSAAAQQSYYEKNVLIGALSPAGT